MPGARPRPRPRGSPLAALAVLASLACREPAPPAPSSPAPAQPPEAPAAATPPPVDASPPGYVLTGDLPEIQKKGVLRFLVPAHDYLVRSRDPRVIERQLAEDVAERMGLRAEFIPVEARDRFLSELAAGHGDVVAAAMTVTAERSEKAAFTRPIRFVKEMVVVPAGDRSIRKPADLAGKEITVRASSTYAATLAALAARVPGIEIKTASEKEDTLDLIQKVARGEAAMTVADSDILEAAMTFEPGVKGAIALTEKDPIAWAVRPDAKALKAVLDEALVEAALTAHKEETYAADLQEIKKRRVLRVLTRNASNSYFLYRGEELGFEYELAKDFAKRLGVRLELLVPPSREALITHLLEGRGDIVAAGITVTPERRKKIDFTFSYLTVSELVVVPASDTTTHELADLKGKKVSVRRSSSYFERLGALKEKLGFEIEILPEDVETEDILRDVGDGKIAATIADSSIVDIELTYSDKIRSVAPLGEPVEIAWAVRKDQPALRAEADAFLKKIYRGVFYNMTVTKYFKNTKNMRASVSPERSDREGRLSEHDEIVRKYAKRYEFDWRLLTSQMYQESRFDPGAKSWAGAVGLMQVMPQTAKELEIGDLTVPENAIHAGVKLLARYSKMFESPEIKEKDRIRFALASYNCGPGHVSDARRLAKDRGLDPNRWFGNVEKAMLLLAEPKIAKVARYGFCRCSEPVKYVSEIQTRYDAYSNLVTLE